MCLAGLQAERPYIAPVAVAPAAEEWPPERSRLRPLIYVYDLPAMYNARMLQYRDGPDQCGHRFYAAGNVSSFGSSREPFNLHRAVSIDEI